jgi:DNA replication protein DnaC
VITCLECGGSGWLQEESMLDGGQDCACVAARDREERFDRDIQRVTQRVIRDQLKVDANNQLAFKLLDSLTYDPQAPFKGVLLYGGVGTGKTCSLIATAHRLAFTAPYPEVSAIPHAPWVDSLRETHGAEYQGPTKVELIRRVARIPVLVLDDVGSEDRGTPFSQSVTRDLLDARTRDGLITLISSNLGDQRDPRWDSILGERAASRLWGLVKGRSVRLQGPDRRRML